MNKFISYITKWGTIANKFVICILVVNYFTIDSKDSRRTIFFNTSIVEFCKYSSIICSTCLIIIIISIIRHKINRRIAKRNKKYLLTLLSWSIKRYVFSLGFHWKPNFDIFEK